MDKSLKLYYYDGDRDLPFPHGMAQAEVFDFTVSKTRMGTAPTISASLSYPVCLDEEWNNVCSFDDVCVFFNGERYFLKSTPSSSKSNDNSFYKHELNFLCERAVLENVYVIDDMENQTQQTLFSNNTNLTFFGDINEYAERINQSMYFAGVGDTCMYSGNPQVIVPIAERVPNGDGYYIVVDSGVTSEEKLVTFNDSKISDALGFIFSTFGVPYYFVGKVIHIGDYEQVVEQQATFAVDGVLGAGITQGSLIPYEYGQPNSVLNVSKSNTSKGVFNRCSGTGSSDNIPYYYPNPSPRGYLSAIADEHNHELLTGDLEITDMVLFSEKMKDDDVCEYMGEYNSITPSAVTVRIPFKFLDSGLWKDGYFTTSVPNEIHLDVQDDYYLIVDENGEFPTLFDFTISGSYNSGFRGNDEIMYFSNSLSIRVPQSPYDEDRYAVPISMMTQCVAKSIGKYVNGVFVGDLSEINYLTASNNYSFFAKQDYVYQVLLTYYVPSSEILRVSPQGSFYISMNAGFDASGMWSMNGNTDPKSFFKLSDIGVKITDGVILTSQDVGDKFTQHFDKYVHPQEKLMPTCYRNSDGNKKFYPAKNYPYEYHQGDTIDASLGDYILNGYVENDNYKDGNGNYYQFQNTYRRLKQRENIESFEDIKPSIKEMTNDDDRRIDMFEEFAYDTNDDNSGYYDEKGNFNYNHPYFFAKLRPLGFNLFDCSIDESEMTIAMTSGHCAPCEFTIMVSEDQKNTVQVDSNGNLLYNQDGNVRCVNESPQDAQNDTTSHRAWIALKKDIDTYGEVMPYNDTQSQTRIRPKACTDERTDDGDTFVILHIELPQAYIDAAEERLTEAVIKWMNDNNTEKFNLSLKFSRVYLGYNPTLIDLLNENVKVKASYNNITKDYFVSSYSYKMQASSPIPEIEIGGLVETTEELKSVASTGTFIDKIGEHISDNFDSIMMGVNKPFVNIIKENNVSVENSIKGEFPKDLVRTKDSLDVDSVVLGAGGSHIRKLPIGADGQVLSIYSGVPTWKDASEYTGLPYQEYILENDWQCTGNLSDSDLRISAQSDGYYAIFANLQLYTSLKETVYAEMSTIDSAAIDVGENGQINLFGIVELSEGDVVFVSIKATKNAWLKASVTDGTNTYTKCSSIKMIKIS